MLKLINVSFSYNNHKVIDDINLEMNSGDFTFLIGKSGCGKSTVLQMIFMNIFPESGLVQFLNFSSDKIKTKQLPILRRKLGIIFQEFRLIKDKTIYDNLSFILEVNKFSSKGIKAKVNDVLNEVGLSHKKNSFPNELSGGEQQRVAIARAIINEPLLILADEPTGNLDPETSMEILETLKKINLRGTAVLIATHNYELIKKSSAKIIKIENGVSAEVSFNSKI